jgi:nitrate reductase gamma subunit
MTNLELLTLARGPILDAALLICAAGIALRLFEVLSLGRKADLAPARPDSPGSGWMTILSRSFPPAGMVNRAPATYIAGYIFHLGLFATIFLFAPHIEIVRDLLGFGWPALPSGVIDAITVASVIALLVLLVDRLSNPVKRLISGFGDYLAWVLTMLPLLTGYLAVNHLLLEYTLMLAIHILSVAALLALLPFTKLFHTISIFISRWFNGEIFGRKGVAS